MNDAPIIPLPPLPPPPRRDGTLPPTAESDGQLHRPNSCSPYCMTVPELIVRFGTSRRRLDLLAGYLGLRAAMRRRRFDRGYQWIGGSFVSSAANPGDIDVTCFIHGSVAWNPEFEILYPDTFDEGHVKELYGCDAHFVDARAPSYLRWVIHWMHIYSAQRPRAGDDPDTHCDRRLGFIEVTNVTADQDAEARAVLVETRRKILGDAEARRSLMMQREATR
jgi:hypothetical protein